MASFPNGVITNKGNDLKSKTDAGVTLELKRLVMGDGVAAQGTDLKTLTGLVNEVKAFDINSFEFLGSGRTKIRTLLSNAGLVTGFYAKEVGLIANDPDEGEILYSYASADPADWIPPETEAFQQIFDIIALTGNTSNITVTLAPNIATVTLAEMQAHEAKELDPTDTDAVKERHLSNAQAKVWQDHGDNGGIHVTSQEKMAWTGHVLDSVPHVTATQKSNWDTHRSSTENPHGVTKEQVGLGVLPNAKTDTLATNSSDVLATAKAAKTLNDLLNTHKNLTLDPASTTTAKDKHLSNAQGKKWDDHVSNETVHTPFAAGTSMVFNQAAAPVGWTKKSDWADNASLIIGNTYGSGGSDSPVNWATNLGVGAHALHGHTITVANHILAITEMPSHDHEIKNSQNAGLYADILVYGERGSTADQQSSYTRITGGGAGHNHTASANNSGPTTHSITQDTYTPKYQIVISATKN